MSEPTTVHGRQLAQWLAFGYDLDGADPDEIVVGIENEAREQAEFDFWGPSNPTSIRAKARAKTDFDFTQLVEDLEDTRTAVRRYQVTLAKEKDRVGRLREALWRVRVHERNADGAPCWCVSETEPTVHEVECNTALAAYHETATTVNRRRMAVATGWTQFMPESNPNTVPLEPAHPEETCERCERPNVWSWSAPSPLWNAVLRDPVTLDDRYNIVCPPCFAELAEEAGVVPAGRTTWRFYPDHPADLAALWPAEPDYRWDDERWLWVEDSKP